MILALRLLSSDEGGARAKLCLRVNDISSLVYSLLKPHPHLWHERRSEFFSSI